MFIAYLVYCQILAFLLSKKNPTFFRLFVTVVYYNFIAEVYFKLSVYEQTKIKIVFESLKFSDFNSDLFMQTSSRSSGTITASLTSEPREWSPSTATVNWIEKHLPKKIFLKLKLIQIRLNLYSIYPTDKIMWTLSIKLFFFRTNRFWRQNNIFITSSVILVSEIGK